MGIALGIVKDLLDIATVVSNIVICMPSRKIEIVGPLVEASLRSVFVTCANIVKSWHERVFFSRTMIKCFTCKRPSPGGLATAIPIGEVVNDRFPPLSLIYVRDCWVASASISCKHYSIA